MQIVGIEPPSLLGRRINIPRVRFDQPRRALLLQDERVVATNVSGLSIR
jgi:hypothetical protein